MNRICKARAIANYVVNYVYQKCEGLFSYRDLIYAEEDVIDFKNIKLQNILYFLYGLYYSKTGKQIFDDDFIAHKYGPIINEVYYEVKQRLRNPFRNIPKFFFSDSNYSELNTDFDIINEILDSILKFSSWRLIELNHLNNSPWKLTKKLTIMNKTQINNYFLKIKFE
ncbi:Panacea domain-containing protein [Spiroplasma culicicola]|uniref:Antitoxin SocA-like Panacea domain-containing protein n=1 Tax=Spiroplasma culicicola AES-1 TaxID=1276246 RepID=W6A7A8_9MOLU|nr:type II toxin-antitoxin system antitoxin SocA domain-containing protein [Spiroplasma culicicola]AHI52866.1 hypothetical protein SCULI_v1c05250 [Spiroplasma culicicola AES-1]